LALNVSGQFQALDPLPLAKQSSEPTGQEVEWAPEPGLIVEKKRKILALVVL
jgi:hypothetical protein